MSKGKKTGKLGILVGGGPAPGINGVIGAATIEARNQGLDVVGILDGFKWLSAGDTTKTVSLSYDDVSTARFRGGSLLHTSRVNPTKDEKMMNNVIESLKKLGITHLVTIGGDDTAYSASKTSQMAAGSIKVAHVPKTIDNDLPLPHNMPTFGYNTARDVGGNLVRGLTEDARTTRRWYVVVAMGRSAGHLALGMGSVAGAPLTLIPEEFFNKNVTLDMLCDIIEAARIKRMAIGRDYGVAVLAEGVAELIKEELAKHPLVKVQYDEHGHFRLAEVPLALILKRMLDARAEARNEKVAYVDCVLGYELRCYDPVPFDVDYTQQLGWGAVRFLLNIGEENYGDSGALISIQSGEIVPIPFTDILDPKTGKTTVRRVNLNSDQYHYQRALMTRLEREDLDDEEQTAKLAAIAKMSPADFKAKYSYILK